MSLQLSFRCSWPLLIGVIAVVWPFQASSTVIAVIPLSCQRKPSPAEPCSLSSVCSSAIEEGSWESVKTAVVSVQHVAATQFGLIQSFILAMLVLAGIAALLERSWSPVSIMQEVALVKTCVLPLQLLELGNRRFCSNGQHSREKQLYGAQANATTVYTRRHLQAASG